MNNIQTNQEHRYVELADSKGRKFKIDIDDYEKVQSFKYLWYVATSYKKNKTKKSYVYSSSGPNNIRTALHRFIIGAQKGQIVDHINGNTMDNRKSNLRFVSLSENARNRRPQSSKMGKQFLGTSFCTTSKKWIASAYLNGKGKFLGRFKTEIEAARAYNKFCIENNISCARLNDV